MSEHISYRVSPPRASWTRLLPPIAFLGVTLFCTFLNMTDMTLRWPYSAKKQPGKSAMYPNTRLIRSIGSREALLTQARDTLEYWWYLKSKESGRSSGPCPYSTTLRGRMPPPEQNLAYVKLDIEVMEAMGFSNLTTCGGIYPRFTADPVRVGSLSDKIQNLLATVDTEAENAEELLAKKFCYQPTFRPPTAANVERRNGSGKVKLTSDPRFCPRLLKLYRNIVAGVEPPLLTMFVYIPDPIEDPAKVSRRYLALNLDLLKPFVQPVLVSDRRMVMAIANSIRWPCLPVEELSPDNVPVFKPLSRAVMDQFNSTFYGHAHGVSIFDASLLETLLEVKEKFLGEPGSKEISPGTISAEIKGSNVFIFGSSLYKTDLNFVSDYSAVGSMAKSGGMWNWPDKESSINYFFHTRQTFTDLPPLKIDDKYLIPILADRSLLRGSRVIDASNTILSLYNIHRRHTNEWDRNLLPQVDRNESYNRVLGSRHINLLKQKISSHLNKPLVAKFGDEGNIHFEEI
ncbi:hypothetical protein PoB_006969400 [Plakobranchus ocellatus]|uniref:Uncharacterized protein n=1 Tax=Plakobranchus ocellatus TaxID=259542 RepID=A0AAV4DG27_9GAST|nr:hypothetical protein PoB_006969400 [Plakobranchus ocellatus]